MALLISDANILIDMETAETVRLVGIHRNTGFNDLLALALAKQQACPILTGDKFLRAAADIENVEVRGTLWLMERMLIEGLLDKRTLRCAYEKMLTGGRRLPSREIEKQLRRLDAEL